MMNEFDFKYYVDLVISLGIVVFIFCIVILILREFGIIFL